MRKGSILVAGIALFSLALPSQAGIRDRGRSGGSQYASGSDEGGGMLRVSQPLTGTEIEDLLAAHNAARSSYGLPPLTLNAKLNQAATAHAQYSASVQRGGHFGIGNGDPWSRIQATGYVYLAATENCAQGPITGADATNLWMSLPSVGHRENILDPRWKEIGFGAADSASGVRYWVACFAAPASPVAETAEPTTTAAAVLAAEPTSISEPTASPYVENYARRGFLGRRR